MLNNNLNKKQLSISPSFNYSDGLLNLEEYEGIYKKIFNFKEPVGKQTFRGYYNMWNRDGLLIQEKTIVVYNSIAPTWQLDKRQRFIDYILVNYYFNRIHIDQEFFETNIFKIMGQVVADRVNLLNAMYERRKPSNFPLLNAVEEKRHQMFLIGIVLWNEWEELDEDKLIQILFYYYKLFLNGINKVVRIKQKLIEFITILYPIFIEYGKMQQRDNIFQFLMNKWRGTPVELNEKILSHFYKKMEDYSDTEFYGVCKAFVEECIETNMYSYETIRTTVSEWSDLTGFCFEVDVKYINKLDSEIRDMFVLENTHKDMASIFSGIRQVLKFYNDILFRENVDNQQLIALFSEKNIIKKPKNVNLVGSMSTGINALISSVGSEIMQSRMKPFSDMSLNEQNNFFIDRAIWMIMATGCRSVEIRKLKLDDIKRSLIYKSPYIQLITAKGNNDREIELFRGEELEEGKYEYDFVHYDILWETILASELRYGSLESMNIRYLYPNSLFNVFDRSNLTKRLNEIQQKNGIVCGSHYDIRSRDFYESMEILRSKAQNNEALFTVHDIRHGNINFLLLHGGLNRYEVQEYIGHNSIKSQEEYEKSTSVMYEVYHLMLDNGHYGAENRLVPSYFKPISDEIDREQLLLFNNVNKYLNDLDESKETFSVSEAEDFIDKNTNCEVSISCSATGITCLGCEDFRAGEFSTVKMDNIAAIISKEYLNIDLEIAKINKHKRTLISLKGKKLLFRAIDSLIKRFNMLLEAKETTLISATTGFGMTEEKAEKFMRHYRKLNRKIELDPVVIKWIKDLKKQGEGEFNNFDITAYRSVRNQKVFR